MIYKETKELHFLHWTKSKIAEFLILVTYWTEEVTLGETNREKINEYKIQFFENISEISKFLDRLIRKRKR